tara:strand:+ start:746 stop:2539 length:1794 start_codon:yes stop_codon:yes gene_type:complete
MAKLTLNRGSTANDGSGDNLRDGANKVNLNFTEIYTAIGDGSTVDGTWKLQDDSSTEAIISANGELLRILGGTAVTTSLSGNDLTIALDTSAVVTAAGSTTLTNKTIALGSNTLSGTTAQFNTALSDGSFATLAGSETLTNKAIALSSNTVTGTAVSFSDDSSSTSNISVGGNLSILGGSGITTSLSGTELTIATDGAVVTETSTDTLTNKTINGPDNTLTNIANSSLANNSVTLGSTAVALGATAASAAGFSLTGASSVSGTGTIDLTSQANKIRFNYATTGDLPSASTYEGMFAYDYGGNNPYVADAGGWVKLLSENASIADISNVGSIASISNGQALIWNSGAGRFDPGAVGGDVVDDTTPQLGGNLDAQGKYVQDVGYVSHRSPDATVTQTLTVTVATQTTEHTNYGEGSSNGYLIDGHEAAHLQLSPGVYKFDQADGSNSGHPLRFYDTESKTTLYSTGVTTSGTPGSAGAHTTIAITKATPSTLHYQCTAHAKMGGVVSVTGSEAPRVTENLTVTGHVLPGANDTYDLGASGNVWRDIYTGDLNLNNMAKQEGNAVNGTKGSWTIQEGDENLFIINNNSGKKYKFKLEEII